MTAEAILGFHQRLAAAFIRGRLANCSAANERLFNRALDQLSAEDLQAIFDLGKSAGLKLHKFKKTIGLQRVTRVVGILRGLAPTSVLDIGSGRGTFLWPLADAMPDLKITCAEINADRVRDINAVCTGGVSNIQALQMDATDLRFPDKSFDVVSALEVLEHIPLAAKALSEFVRVSSRFVIISVPKHEDDNPEHIHLFDESGLRDLAMQAGARAVKAQYTLSEMILVISV